MRVYIDTSAYSKRYIAEPGADRVFHILEHADSVVTSALILPEMTSVLSRYVRERSLAMEDYSLFKRVLERDLGTMEIIPLGSTILQEAARCLERSSTKTLDAIHLATALQTGCDRFVTADRRQHEAAIAAGMRTEWIRVES